MSDAARLRDLSDAVGLLLRSHLEALRTTPVLASERREEVLNGLLADLTGALSQEVAAIDDLDVREVVERRVSELEGTLYYAVNLTQLAARLDLSEAPEQAVEAYAKALFGLRRVDEAANALAGVLREAAGTGRAAP
ncbi:MAG TPA: hypothetical protein VNZ52_08915, partial [Candidatus Thermoplasmatota archaeon]|nr:hypothetical protein [Candidatus Thermoplasmatota archaeon]